MDIINAIVTTVLAAWHFSPLLTVILALILIYVFLLVVELAIGMVWLRIVGSTDYPTRKEDW